jgi:hypothetical protein
MSMLDDGPIPAMEGVLSSIINPDSITGTASHLLARDSFQPDPNRARKAAGHLLGCHRQLHELLSGRSVVGDEQPLVGNQQRRRELAAQTWGAMGRSAVGLDRGGGQVRSPDGRMLFCNGLGRGAASGTQWVLNRARARAPSYLFHTPPPSPLSAPSQTFLISHPRSCGMYSCTRVPPPAMASHGARQEISAKPPNALRGAPPSA